MKNSKVRKVAVLSPNKRFFGAQIVSAPFFLKLREMFPGAEVIAVSPTEKIKIIEDLGLIDRVFISKTQGFTGYINLIQRIRRENIDILITLRRKSERDWLINIFSKAKYKIGFKRKWSPLVYHKYIRYDKNIYRATNFMKLLQAAFDAEITYKKMFPEYSCSLPKSVWLIPCSQEKERQWAINNYIELAKKIISELDLDVTFILGKYELKYLASIKSIDKELSSRIFIGDDRFKSKELMGEVNNCRAAVANNCGPGHIVQVSGTDCIVLFNKGTNINEWINRESTAKALVSPLEDINSLSVEEVYSNLLEVLKNG